MERFTIIIIVTNILANSSRRLKAEYCTIQEALALKASVFGTENPSMDKLKDNLYCCSFMSNSNEKTQWIQHQVA